MMQFKTSRNLTARPATVAAVVSSPWLPGKTDRVERVLDSVLQLRRAGQITAAQYEAAEHYREAYEAVRAGIGGSMDPDRTGGGQSSGRTPAPRALWGADQLADANKALAKLGSTVIVEMIVGHGSYSRDVAVHLFGSDTRRNRDHVGAFLRLSLSVLAGIWGDRRKQNHELRTLDGRRRRA